MSAALVRKSLEIVESEDTNTTTGRNKEVFGLVTENQKLIKKVKKQGQTKKINLMSARKKLNIVEVKKTIKSKEEILKQNLKKLEQVRAACAIDLDKDITKKIIERAVTRRPIKTKSKSKKSQKTAFTEEDFKKFEAEYFG